jgi:hypothetical protein
VNKVQLGDARRGVDLLLGHLNCTDETLWKAAADEDLEAFKEAADPLMTVATILVRKLRTALGGTVESALNSVRVHLSQGAPRDHVANVEQHIGDLVLGDKPRRITSSNMVVAVISYEIAVGAAKELGKLQNKHSNAVIANLRNELKSNSHDVQISDPERAAKVALGYAADEKMQAARVNALSKIATHLTDAGFKLHDIGQQDGLEPDCRDRLEGLALVTVTAASLTAGIWHLAQANNMYPAHALLRQLVECEFVLWKFAQGASQSQEWLRSSPEQRRNSWKPATIYRDDNNDFRQKDYGGHCENGGHPTPVGSRMAAGIMDLTITKANLFSDSIGHAKDSWRHMLESVSAIDAEHEMNISDTLSETVSKFTDTWNEWSATDMFKYAITAFLDPTP